MKEFKNPQYLNFDNSNDRKILHQMSWRLNADLLIFDEIHKMKNWKNYLKGVYDSRSENQTFLVTGSSRMDTFRQSGESLAGRYFHLRLNPLSVKEILDLYNPYEAIEKLNTFGGFPEPLLSNSEIDAARWRIQYYTDLIREDIMEFGKINEIQTMKFLLELLQGRVGSPLSYSSIAVDLQVSPNTIKKYIQILESLHIIFLIRPYHKRLERALQREPKLYFYDTGFIKGSEEIRLENTVAISLLKHVEYVRDTKGKNISLGYLKTKDGKEVDFVVVQDNELEQMIEVKLSGNNLSSSLALFSRKFPSAKAFQLIHNLRQPQNLNDIDLVQAGEWLANLEA